MIYTYGVTEIGPYHIKNGIICQDANYIKKISDSCAIAAAADGLGSEKYSDIASKIASQTAVEFCAEHFSPEMEESDILGLIMQSFRIAQCKIEDTAKQNEHELSDYDTTLVLVIYCGGTVYFGHAGDSGIIVQTNDGLYGPLTQQDRDDYGRVFPLIFEDHWKFGKAPKPVASVLLCTDGILDILFPVLLRDQPVSIYVALAQFFMDKERLGFEEDGEAAVTEAMTTFIAGLQEDQVDDDKTVVVMCDSAIEVTPQEDKYYAVPDFASLEKEHREKFMREAYPHLSKKDEEVAASASSVSADSDETGRGEGTKQKLPAGTELTEEKTISGQDCLAGKVHQATDIDKEKQTFGQKLRKKLRQKETP